MTYYIRSASLNGYLATASEFGIDANAALRSVGLSRRVLLDPDACIQVAAFARLLENSARLAGADDFGLRMAETRQLSNLGPLALVAAHESTLRQALKVIFRYLRLHNESLFLRMDEANGRVTIIQSIACDWRWPSRQLVELCVGALHRMISSMLGDAWQPLVASFMHSAPARLTVYRRLFSGARIVFGSDFDGLVCQASELEKSLPAGDPVLAGYAREFLERLGNGAIETHADEKVCHLVRTLLPFGRCTADCIAGHLGIDRRTLHRQLVRVGTNFSELVAQVRREDVERYLLDGSRPLHEVARLLGFGGPSAFSEWFRSHYGCSATQWRARTQLNRIG